MMKTKNNLNFISCQTGYTWYVLQDTTPIWLTKLRFISKLMLPATQAPEQAGDLCSSLGLKRLLPDFFFFGTKEDQFDVLHVIFTLWEQFRCEPWQAEYWKRPSNTKDNIKPAQQDIDLLQRALFEEFQRVALRC